MTWDMGTVVVMDECLLRPVWMFPDLCLSKGCPQVPSYHSPVLQNQGLMLQMCWQQSWSMFTM